MSKLATKTLYAKHQGGKRTERITKIAIHHMAGKLDVETCARVLNNNRASANYLIGHDGIVAIHVPESNRSYCTSSEWCDQRAVTIETSNSSMGGNWPVSDLVLNKLIDLVEDICERNNIYPCTYTGNKSGTLQMHKWYTATACPGPYLGSKFKHIADTVTARLKAKRAKVAPGAPAGAKESKPMYKVQIGAFSNYDNAKALADKATKAGFKVYIEGAPAVTKPLGIGDRIRIKQGAKDLNSERTFASFVYQTEYQVLAIEGDYVSFGPKPYQYTGKVAKSNVERV